MRAKDSSAAMMAMMRLGFSHRRQPGWLKPPG
jgi:hypothetical protein